MDVQTAERFLAWLPDNNVVAGADDYVSRLRTVQTSLGSSIEDLLRDGVDRAVERVNHQNIPHVAESTLRHMQAAIRKYQQFLQD